MKLVPYAYDCDSMNFKRSYSWLFWTSPSTQTSKFNNFFNSTFHRSTMFNNVILDYDWFTVHFRMQAACDFLVFSYWIWWQIQRGGGGATGVRPLYILIDYVFLKSMFLCFLYLYPCSGLTCGAVCVYSSRVCDAVKALKDAGASHIPVASGEISLPLHWGIGGGGGGGGGRTKGALPNLSPQQIYS